MNIALLATAWGTKFGGINSFNRDLALGLAEELRGVGSVSCAVLNATENEVSEAAKRGVRLISLTRRHSSGEFDPSWIHDVYSHLRSEDSAAHVDCWLGHDVVSGEAALHGAEVFSGSVTALIHHMDYEAYKAVESGSSRHAEEKLRHQQKVFGTERALLFAIGPTLVESCKRLTQGLATPTMLVPGFPEFMGRNYSPDDRIVAVASGRLDSAADRLKQGKLAVAAFGKAKRLLSERKKKSSLGSAVLYVVGTDPGAVEERSLYDFVDNYAGEAVNLLPLSFTEDRETYLRDLRGANLAFMLSWHEGFGLVGWEAIAAGIPLILGKRSGLFRLIEENLHSAGIGGVIGVDIQAKRNAADGLNFTDRTLDEVADKIVEVAENIRGYKTDAHDLKDALVRKFGCSWTDTAKTMLARLTASAASVEVSSSSPQSGLPQPAAVLDPGLGIEAVYRSSYEYTNTEIMKEPGHLIVVMNDGRSWLRNRREALAERVRIRKQRTTIVLIHPKSDFLPTLLRRNALKTMSDQIGELRQAFHLVEDLQRGGDYPIELRGHFLFNPSVIFATERLAVVMPYFVGSEGEMPALVLRSVGEEALHKLWWAEAQAIEGMSVPVNAKDYE